MAKFDAYNKETAKEGTMQEDDAPAQEGNATEIESIKVRKAKGLYRCKWSAQDEEDIHVTPTLSVALHNNTKTQGPSYYGRRGQHTALPQPQEETAQKCSAIKTNELKGQVVWRCILQIK